VVEEEKIGRLLHRGQTLRLPDVSEDDSLCYQIESLRMFLEKQLGEERFIEVYRLLEDMGEGDDEDAITKQVASLLGPGWKEPFQMVVRLLLCEDTLNSRSC
jgi:NIMA (never in mitosis gene a)-related kinase 1/4/5